MVNASLFKSKASQVKNTKHFAISALIMFLYFYFQHEILSSIYSVIKDVNHFVNLPKINVNKWMLGIVMLYPLFTFWKMLCVWNEEYAFNKGRLIVTSGVLNKKSDYLEYFRVKDYSITRTLIERPFSLCTLNIISTDRTNPILELSYIKNFSRHEPSFRDAIDEATASGRGREVDIV